MGIYVAYMWAYTMDHRFSNEQNATVPIYLWIFYPQWQFHLWIIIASSTFVSFVFGISGRWKSLCWWKPYFLLNKMSYKSKNAYTRFSKSYKKDGRSCIHSQKKNVLLLRLKTIQSESKYQIEREKRISKTSPITFVIPWHKKGGFFSKQVISKAMSISVTLRFHQISQFHIALYYKKPECIKLLPVFHITCF